MIGLGLSQSLVQTQKLSQQQILTPLQLQRIGLLEVPDYNLAAHLDEFVRANPALTWTPDGGSRATEKAYVPVQEEEGRSFEESHGEGRDLTQELIEGWGLVRTTDDERVVGEHIIFNLDDRGLLGSSLAELAELAGVDLETAEDARDLIMRRLEPVGCGADDLPHYFIVAFELEYGEDPFWPEIVGDHLDDLLKGRFDRIAKAIDMDEEDVEEYREMLAKLSPFPAHGYAGGGGNPEHIRPTMIISRHEVTRRFVVEMQDPPRQRVQINKKFERELEKMPDGPAKQEAIERLRDAQALMQQLDERHSLVKQVAEVAVTHQHAYFDRGPTAIRNLTMSNVADMLQVDTSTISRAVAGRYYIFEGRTEPLRELFVNRGASQDTSEAKLHALLQQLIDGEPPDDPLSDDALSKLLRQHGVKASRRTVAKHRDRMGVPSSRDRKRR